MEVTNAKNTINNFKRLIGRRFHDSCVQQEKQFNAYSIVEGPNGSVNVEVRLKLVNTKVIEIQNLG
jgi:molecular chaperone DnaK (HSP70)